MLWIYKVLEPWKYLRSRENYPQITIIFATVARRRSSFSIKRSLVTVVIFNYGSLIREFIGPPVLCIVRSSWARGYPADDVEVKWTISCEKSLILGNQLVLNSFHETADFDNTESSFVVPADNADSCHLISKLLFKLDSFLIEVN